MNKTNYLTEEKFEKRMEEFEERIMTAVQKGFKEVYERFEDLEGKMNTRFDGVDKRLNNLTQDKARRQEVDDLEKRVEVLEHKVV